MIRRSLDPSLTRFLIFGLSIAIAWMPGCGRERTAIEKPADPLLREREDRDKAFKSSPESPIPDEARTLFTGLDYFPLNPALRFKVRLVRYAVPAGVRLATNKGDLREGLRYGYFDFSVDGTPLRLQVYRMDESNDPGPPMLFIPFKDATAGKETYAAGRYLDLKENTTGTYDLDFNKAYNPYCAYGGDFSCPIPPDENRLTVPIHAGEKTYTAPFGK